MSFLASFLPLDPSAGLQPFQIQPCDGRVVIGRGALTGISKNIVSRNLGAVWVTPAGEALFEKNGSSAVYLRKGAGEKDEEELRTGSVTVLSNGVLPLHPVQLECDIFER